MTGVDERTGSGADQLPTPLIDGKSQFIFFEHGAVCSYYLHIHQHIAAGDIPVIKTQSVELSQSGCNIPTYAVCACCFKNHSHPVVHLFFPVIAFDNGLYGGIRHTRSDVVVFGQSLGWETSHPLPVCLLPAPVRNRRHIRLNAFVAAGNGDSRQNGLTGFYLGEFEV